MSPGDNNPTGLECICRSGIPGEYRLEFLLAKGGCISRLNYTMKEAFTLILHPGANTQVLLFDPLLNMVVPAGEYYEKPFAGGKGRLLITGYPVEADTEPLPIFNAIIMDKAVQDVCRQLLDTSCISPLQEKYLHIKREELFLLLCNQLATQRNNLVISNTVVSHLKRVLETVQQNPDQHYTIDALAKLASMNVYAFERSFRALFGKPVHQYLKSITMERARGLLREGEHSIKEVAYLLGFSSESNFTRDYKSYFGCTPGSERRSVK